MSGVCEVTCIEWPLPDLACVNCPCIDLSTVDGEPVNAEHWQLFLDAYSQAASYVYRETGCRWPGKGWRETVRPCIKGCLVPECRCGRWVAVDLTDAFCLDFCELESVTEHPNACNNLTEPYVWPEGSFRVDYVYGAPHLVRQGGGCCKMWPYDDLCEPNGFEITAITGCNPPPDILAATAAFACCLVQECIDTGCDIPDAVTTLARPGVTFNLDQGENDLGGGLLLKMLETELAKDPDPPEQFFDPYDQIRWHRQRGPHDFVAEPSC